jgi:16S rRNA (guanine527-N7)-methyltransferase
MVDRWQLPGGSAARLATLLELLARDDQAPTAVRDPRRAIDDHLADSFVALELTVVREACTIADLGAGAGFPGLALAIALPRSEVALVESSARKCEFVRRAITACRLRNATVVNARIEEWSAGAGRLDLCTARAPTPLPAVVEYAAPLLRLGGALVAWRGRRDVAAERLAEAAASELGLEVADPIRVRPYSGARHRYLHLMSKVRPTPDRYPRRPGLAVKRPLVNAPRIAASEVPVRSVSDRPRR